MTVVVASLRHATESKSLTWFSFSALIETQVSALANAIYPATHIELPAKTSKLVAIIGAKPPPNIAPN